MARERVRAAARKALLAAQQRQMDEADVVAVGVRQVAKEVAPLLRPGALYWYAPTQYVAEQMAPRVCAEYELPVERVDEVAAYLMHGMQEFVTALVGEFNAEHFEAWTAAMDARVRSAPGSGSERSMAISEEG